MADHFFRVPLSAFLLSMALHASVSAAASGNDDDTRTWIVSGRELIDALEGSNGTAASRDENSRSKQAAKGSSYIAGVADATSASWCAAGAVLPHELTDRVYSYLRSIEPGRLEERASTLVIEGLARSFPCPADQ